MTTLPPVAPDVAAAVVEALSPRLRKRLDGAVDKLAARPITVQGDVVRIAIDDETDLTLQTTEGVVRTTQAVVCGCLLAPACLHRAAAVSAAPVGEPAASQPAVTPDCPEPQDQPAADPAAVHSLWTAGAAVLDAGLPGSGAVLQAELLRAAHTARLAGLHHGSAAAVRTVTALRSARAAEPDFRLAELAAALHDLLDAAHTPVHGGARQAYAQQGSLRVYGLFTEPVLSSRGYAGAVTYTADAEGVIRTVADVAPGGPERAVNAADRAVRVGDTAIDHRTLGRQGLLLSGATVSATGRLGAGAKVNAARAGGAAWTEAPLARLWETPPADQVARALKALYEAPDQRAAGADLLFLDLTVIGPSGSGRMAADCGGVTVQLRTAHDHPQLAYRDNLRLLASRSGLRLRGVGRLEPGLRPAVTLLAVSLGEDHLDLGLDRLQQADLPGAAGPVPVAAETPDVRLDLLTRHVERSVSGGRRILALSAAADVARLRRAGLTTGAATLEALLRAAADQGRDAFGRLTPADRDAVARSWLAASLYARAAGADLCQRAWTPA